MNWFRRILLALVLAAGVAPAFAQAPPPVPALPDTERRTTYTISGSTCACAVGFQLYGDSTDIANWLTVWINGVQIAQAGNWSITSPTGQIGLIPRPITDAVLTFTNAQTGTVQIVGAQRPRRLTEFTENRGVAARDLNQAMNSFEVQARELWDRQFRTVQAPPGETLAVLPAAASRANMGACFDSSGNLTSCVAAASGTFSAGSGITFTGTNPTTISTSTYSAGSGIQFTGSNPTVISVSQTSNTPVVPSRTTAQTLDLHAYGAVKTMGYAAAGDGGEATFKNVGSNAFIDSYITTFTITGGSGYTSSSYFGVIWVSGSKAYAIGTATVSGGVVTAVSVAGTPGNQCHIGDVYTTSSIPGGTGASITVTGCSTPLGSFTDSAGTHFQLVTGPNAWPNIAQFGAVGDWAGSDASATDNYSAIQAALWFTGNMIQQGAGGNGGFWGGRLLMPQGTFKVCGAGNVPLIIPNGVTFEGASNQGSVIRMCDAFGTGLNFIELCDPNWHFACFNSRLENLQVSASQAAGSAVNGSGGTFAIVHSRSTQDFGGVFHVYVYGGKRTCLWLEHGDGGASTMSVEHLSCTTASSGAQVQIGNTSASGLNFGTTMINMDDVVLGGPSSGSVFQSTSGVLILGGFVVGRHIHCESMPTCVEINNNGAISAGQVNLMDINAGSGAPAPACTGVVQLDSTNTQSNTVVAMVPAGSCPNTITNGVASGTNFTATITKAISCTTTCS